MINDAMIAVALLLAMMLLLPQTRGVPEWWAATCDKEDSRVNVSVQDAFQPP